jgi:flagellar biosynthesis GTPase FlhF
MSPSSAALLDMRESVGPEALAGPESALPVFHSSAEPLAGLAEQAPDAGESRIYRGRSVEELIPRIESELGTDAIVLRRRKGLSGGIGGFFQRPFVEIEARRGAARIDLYDEATGAPALPPSLQSLSTAHPPAPANSPARPAVTRPAEGTYVTGPLVALAAARSRERAQETHSPTFAATDPGFTGPEPSGIAAEPDFMTTGPSILAAEPNLRASEFRELNPDELLAGDCSVPEADDRAQEELHQFAPEPLYRPVSQSLEDPFAAALAAAETAAAQAYPTEPPPAVEISAARGAGHMEPTPAEAYRAPQRANAPSQRLRSNIEDSLLELGISAEMAHQLVDTATAHVAPLAPRLSLARAVHRALTARIPACAPLPPTGGSIAVIGAGGSGKTGCCAALLGAYRKNSTLPARCATIIPSPERGELELLLSPDILTPTPVDSSRARQVMRHARTEGLLLLDMPAVSPGDRAAIRTIAKLLGELEPDRIVLAVPATLGAKPAAQLLEALRPLGASALAITHADETDQIGVTVEAACNFGLAPEYLLEGRRGLTPLDPTGLADRLLP